MKIETAINYLESMVNMTKIQNQVAKSMEANIMIEAVECLVSHTKKYRMIEIKNELNKIIRK